MARKTSFIAAALVLGLTAPAITLPALAAEGETHMEHLDWSFSGPFGTFDQEQLPTIPIRPFVKPSSLRRSRTKPGRSVPARTSAMTLSRRALARWLAT